MSDLFLLVLCKFVEEAVVFGIWGVGDVGDCFAACADDEESRCRELLRCLFDAPEFGVGAVGRFYAEGEAGCALEV